MAKLSNIQQQYILHWGEMGTRWGINRTVAQIHALLYLSPKPLAAEEIAETLTVARSNVSTSIRELEGWGIVRAVHVLGDRREHYESMKDVWEMFRLIVEQRKRREVDPTIQLLRQCLEPRLQGAEEGKSLRRGEGGHRRADSVADVVGSQALKTGKLLFQPCNRRRDIIQRSVRQ